MKYALVTGGNKGIGRAICFRLAEVGYHVIINYRSHKEEAEETLRSIQEMGSHGTLLPFDVSDQAQANCALNQWQQDHPQDYIEVLVNNAGIRQDALMLWMEKKQWSDVLNINLNGFYYVTQPLLKSMLVNKFGRIVNIVSLSGIKGMPGQTNYSAAKGGVIAATKALALETAKKGVTVNAVAPGFIASDMTEQLNESELKKLIPMGRFGQPDDVAGLVTFLVSKQASYITGEVISVNGGLYT